MRRRAQKKLAARVAQAERQLIVCVRRAHLLASDAPQQPIDHLALICICLRATGTPAAGRARESKRNWRAACRRRKRRGFARAGPSWRVAYLWVCAARKWKVN